MAAVTITAPNEWIAVRIVSSLTLDAANEYAKGHLGLARALHEAAQDIRRQNEQNLWDDFDQIDWPTVLKLNDLRSTRA